MKVAFVIERMDVGRGGRETSTAEVATALARRGHDVTILCESGSWEPDGVNVAPLGRRGLHWTARLKNFLADVADEIRRVRFDVVHAMLPMPGANVYQLRSGTVPAQRAAGRRRCNIVGRWAALLAQPLNRRRNAMAQLEYQVVCESGTICLAVSQMVAEELREYYGRQDRVRVVYNAVDAPEAASPQRGHWRQRQRYMLGIGSSDLVFLTVATNFELKGVAEMIEAFDRWYHGRRDRSAKVRLVIVGRSRPEGYQRHAGLRGLGVEVVFVAPTDQIHHWYAAADACVLLSWYDPCSRVVLEATRWGIPSITTVYNGASEILGDGAGIVVGSPKDRRAIAAAMEDLADPRRRAMRVQACLDVA